MTKDGNRDLTEQPARERDSGTNPDIQRGAVQFESMRQALVRRRRELGLSMSELARQIGVSPSMVSQIERGHTLPSVVTLFALANALGATVDAFFSEPDDGEASALHAAEPFDVREPFPAQAVSSAEQGPYYVVRGGQRAGIDIRGGVRWERLTPVSFEQIEILELIYKPGAQSDSELYRHPGVEMVHVLEGRFTIHIGFGSYDLAPGDSATFPSSLPHRYVNPTDSVSRALTVILREPLDSLGPLQIVPPSSFSEPDVTSRPQTRVPQESVEVEDAD
jgi:transcriptional regulator with XRE-family HTH domain